MQDESRRVALDTYLADCEQEGFEVETRTSTQAVIVRRGRGFLRRPRTKKHNDDRIVVWVDEHGAVSTRSIEPRRW
jgi:hypothetical protein